MIVEHWTSRLPDRIPDLLPGRLPSRLPGRVAAIAILATALLPVNVVAQSWPTQPASSTRSSAFAQPIATRSDSSQTGTGQTDGSQTDTGQRATSTPYRGDLSIFEYKDRDAKLQPQRIMDILGIAPGKAVADIGAGSGWFTVRAAARVGQGGTVYAEDINPDAVEYIRNRAAQEKLPQVHAVLGSPSDPKLPAASVDAMLIMKTYHEFARPVELMQKLKLALKPGARVGIIDRNGDGTDHGLMPDVVEREMTRAGYRLAGKYDFTKADGQDYFLVFIAD